MRQVVDLLRENGWGERYRLPTLSLDRGVGVTLSRFAAVFQPSGLRSYMRDQLGGRMQFDNSKARRELDMEFMDVDRSILDTMDDLERWGHLGTRR
jgi:dihydroflavonol-4-reductase